MTFWMAPLREERLRWYVRLWRRLTRRGKWVEVGILDDDGLS